MTEIWPEMVSDILQNYVKTVEVMHRRDLLIVGITKTSGSAVALDALETRMTPRGTGVLDANGKSI